MALHLVTGGCGYLGSFISRRLLEMGESVRALDVLDDAPEAVTDFARVDVRDRAAVDEAMKGVDFVHHNAALVPLRKAGHQFWEVNVEGTRTVLQAAKAAGVAHFTHMSSSAIFGNVKEADCPIGDDPSHLHPVEIYGRSKFAAEQAVKEELEKGKMSCSIIRPRTILGTERLGIFQILFEWISEGRNPYIIGNGENLFQFAHVNDIVEVSIETAMRQVSGLFNIGTDRYDTLRNTLQALCDEAGTGSKVRGIPVSLAIPSLWLLDKSRLSPLGPWHYMTYHKPYYFDLTTPFAKLQWRPRMSNHEMLMASYGWYLENRERLEKQKARSAHRGTLKHGIIKLLKHFS